MKRATRVIDPAWNPDRRDAWRAAWTIQDRLDEIIEDGGELTPSLVAEVSAYVFKRALREAREQENELRAQTSENMIAAAESQRLPPDRDSESDVDRIIAAQRCMTVDLIEAIRSIGVHSGDFEG